MGATSTDSGSSRRSLLPLAAMALAFFVPTYRTCSDAPFHAPAHYAGEGLAQAAWISPVYLFAAVFAVLTAVALRQGQVSRALRRLGLAALAAFASVTAGLNAVLVGSGEGDWPWLVAALVTALAAAALVRRARGHGPWQIWEHLVGAYAVLAMGTAPAIFLAGDLARGATHSTVGAFLFVGAHLALTVLIGHALWRARKLR